VMSRLFIIKCWLTRHLWVLVAEQPLSYYMENDKVATYMAYYACQRCAKITTEQITNLDNLPEEMRDIL